MNTFATMSTISGFARALAVAALVPALAVGCTALRQGQPSELTDSGTGDAGASDGSTNEADGSTGAADSSVPLRDADTDASEAGALPMDSGTLSDSSVEAGADSGDDAQVEGVGFGSFACNPLTNAGCDGAQRCGWVSDSEDSTTACVAEGTVSSGLACEYGTGGVDDCESGSVCIGTCAKICLLDDREGCPTTDYCLAYLGIFNADDDTYLAGSCVMGCDPVTQLTNANESCSERLGCFLSVSPTDAQATCLPARSTPLVQDDPIVGTIYLNGCTPGFTNILDEDGNPVCTALCTPVETHSGSTVHIAGEAPHTCAARGASASHECRYVWYFRELAQPHPLLNRVGVCVDPTNRLYDSNSNGTPDTAWPSCADLPNTDTDGDGIAQHAQWGCAPRRDSN